MRTIKNNNPCCNPVLFNKSGSVSSLPKWKRKGSVSDNVPTVLPFLPNNLFGRQKLTYQTSRSPFLILGSTLQKLNILVLQFQTNLKQTALKKKKKKLCGINLQLPVFVFHFIKTFQSCYNLHFDADTLIFFAMFAESEFNIFSKLYI